MDIQTSYNMLFGPMGHEASAQHRIDAAKTLILHLSGCVEMEAQSEYANNILRMFGMSEYEACHANDFNPLDQKGFIPLVDKRKTKS